MDINYTVFIVKLLFLLAQNTYVVCVRGETVEIEEATDPGALAMLDNDVSLSFLRVNCNVDMEDTGRVTASGREATAGDTPKRFRTSYLARIDDTTLDALS